MSSEQFGHLFARRGYRSEEGNKVKVPAKSIVMENGAKIEAFPCHRDGPSAALLAAMQEGFGTLCGNMYNAPSEAFKKYPMTRKFKRKIDCNNVRKMPNTNSRAYKVV